MRYRVQRDAHIKYIFHRFTHTLSVFDMYTMYSIAILITIFQADQFSDEIIDKRARTQTLTYA